MTAYKLLAGLTAFNDARSISELMANGRERMEDRNLLDRVLRLPSQPQVVLRELGSRRLTDVPALERAAAAEHARSRSGGSLDGDESIRAVARLDGRQKVSASLRAVIGWALGEHAS